MKEQVSFCENRTGPALIFLSVCVFFLKYSNDIAKKYFSVIMKSEYFALGKER